jgi:uncharacterized protein
VAVDEPDLLEGIDLDEVAMTLRAAGARFAYLHGSVASGTAGPDSDVDVAAHFGGADPASWRVRLPGRVDLVVLDSAPLELAGRVALHGRLLFDDDPPARVRWEATTRKIYLDEQPRMRQATADLVAGVRASVSRQARG